MQEKRVLFYNICPFICTFDLRSKVLLPKGEKCGDAISRSENCKFICIFAHLSVPLQAKD